ncbi:lipase family protein [Nocardia sp. NPDC059177]|uniref:lipase family protein n=1 Tax=Nocardia sp. NPDC059177 TaxID=3346759 RepID=UPI0036B68A34
MNLRHARIVAGKQRGRLVRGVIALTIAVCTGTAAAVLGTPAASAQIFDEAFYTPPASFAETPGSVIRTASMPILQAVPGVTGWPVPAQRVLYTSLTQDDEPVAVSGVYIEANRPWSGAGERPTVIIAPGTTGQGDQCAISKAFPLGMYIDPANPSLSANQELASAAVWNALGARVFVTDYIGMGTPGVHTYVNRVEQAHAVLDAARAANTLSGTGPDTPLALWGYSQGGGATAAATELAPQYAPELNVRGTWAGGPTADLTAVIDEIDGALIAGVIGMAVNGFIARYPDLRGELDSRLSPTGAALLDEAAVSCIADVIFKHPFVRTTDMTIDHRPIMQHLLEVPAAREILAAQRIGNLRPPTPVLITSGINDDTVPYGQARQLAVDWCDQGATVTFRSNTLPPILPGATIPNHFGPQIIDGYGPDNAFQYLLDRFADKPLPEGCTIA